MTPAGAGSPRLRINRFLASRGVASRRGADELVAAGRVRVGGRPAEPGTLVDPRTDAVTVDGVPVPAATPARTLAVNKPTGVLSTRRDPQGRRTVLDLVDDPARLVTVGRLDADSRGLLLLTTDGELAARLTHPRHGVTKRYVATVRGRVTDRALRELTSGIDLEDGPARALEARVGHPRGGLDTIELTMAEGRKREVRRLCAAVGLPVSDLQRVAVGPVALGRLLEGGSRRVRGEELRSLYAAAGLSPAVSSAGAGGPRRGRGPRA